MKTNSATQNYQVKYVLGVNDWQRGKREQWTNAIVHGADTALARGRSLPAGLVSVIQRFDVVKF